jgi:hypothetical protein
VWHPWALVLIAERICVSSYKAQPKNNENVSCKLILAAISTEHESSPAVNLHHWMPGAAHPCRHAKSATPQEALYPLLASQHVRQRSVRSDNLQVTPA